MIYFFIIALTVGTDQLSKFFIQRHMELGQSIPVISDFFNITYIHNYGAAFSIFQDQKLLLIGLPLVMILFIMVYMFMKRKSAHPAFMISLSLIASGGLGNLIDRLVYGYVMDFFSFGRFPIFNVADISVCTGCGLLILYMIFIEPKLENRNENDKVVRIAKNS